MWNQINGTIPKEIGNIKTLELLLLNGNNLSGSLPEEIGYLTNLNRLQIDENQITGPIPESFANLSNIQHLHMNNNSLNGQIPSGLSRLQALYHLLIDNNNLSGHLPPEIAAMPKLKILQLDNNNFSGSSIPDVYGNMTTLLKLSLRNCSLEGTIPDFSMIPELGYLDLSWNQLTGPIPSKKLSINITTIVLSNNFLNGTIPINFTGLPKLQKLSLENNSLDGSVPSFIWKNLNLSGGNESLILNFQNNSLEEIPDNYDPPANVTVLLYGNPVCSVPNQETVVRFCQPETENLISGRLTKVLTEKYCEYNPKSVAPLGVGYRLKSPGISDFRPYIDNFKDELTKLLNLSELYVESYLWETGPRLSMNLKLCPSNNTDGLRVEDTLSGWTTTLPDVFGPYELLNIRNVPDAPNTVLSIGSLVGILLGAIAGATILSATVTILIMRKRSIYQTLSKRRTSSSRAIKIDGVKCFTYEEMALASNHFSDATQVGRGSYGKVFKGTIADGTVVAIKRAEEGSFQGSKEFLTEIELLSRLHHRNLVSLVGYCAENDDQMLVYEFISNGSLRDYLSAKSREHLSFLRRLHIALGSAKGILYLHTEAYPPIFHRDIKASNILLDHNFTAKVADFGLSRLAPVPDVEGVVPLYVSTVVKGTPGYIDPEYCLTHMLTDKSDVYSLGVVFLELLTAMPPISNGKNIVREVSIAYQSGTMFSIIDSRMEDYPPKCVDKFVSLALSCCRDTPDERPSMSEVVRNLESIILMMPENTSVLKSEFTMSLEAPILSEGSSSNLANTEIINVAPR